MPSTLLFSQSGGIALVSGDIFSGAVIPFGSVEMKLAAGAPGVCYVGIRRKFYPDTAAFSGFLSGAVTVTSGGSLSSGGWSDGMELSPGDRYNVPRLHLSSGIQDIRIAVPAASSGGRLFYELFGFLLPIGIGIFSIFVQLMSYV